MTAKFALAFGLGLAFCSPVMAETYISPDRAWWSTFFQAVDGVQPDFETIAKNDPAYLAADEFDRADILTKLIADLQSKQAAIDVPAAEVVISIRANLGDYSVENSGFPVSIFTQSSHLTLDANSLYFQNWENFNIFAATKEEGRVLRERIGAQALAADVTVTNFKKSTTRPRAYEGFVTKVAYFADDGLPVAEFTATEAGKVSPSDAADQVTAARQKIIDAAGIPPLGTSWDAAKGLLPDTYPFIGSDDFAYTDSGKKIAYQFEGGRIVTDEAHDAEKPFRVYLQQAEGAWRTTRGFSFDMDAGDSVSIKGTGPGLACYTPDVNDRCAVLEFSPSDGGHVLTRAFGVIEMARATSAQNVLEAFVADSLPAFEGFTAQIDYDADTVKQAKATKFPGRRGVPAYAAGAGATREGEAFYDPLQNTTNIIGINREIALFAVEGASERVPMIFVIQQ